MKPLAEYTAADWRRLRPLTHAMKTVRYRFIRAAYLRRPLDTTAIRAAIAGRRLIVTIAFEDPQLIDWQLALVARYVPDIVHLVADNSMSDGAASAIAHAAARHGALYLRLPRNPWSGVGGSRSHGLALDWLWRHVIDPARPSVFGFIDHDLFPLAPCDPFAALASRPVAGDKRWAGGRWFLWAGYCFFRTEALSGRKVSFGQDWFIGLDTGGGNWRSIYRHLDPATIAERPIELIPVVPPGPTDNGCLEQRGEWLHEAGSSWSPDYSRAKRAALAERLAPHLAGETITRAAP